MDDLRAKMLEEFVFSQRIVRSGTEVVPRFRILAPDGEHVALVQLKDDIADRLERLDVMRAFMVHKAATGLLLSSELITPEAILVAAVTRTAVIGALQPIKRDPLRFGKIEWFGPEGVDEMIVHLLPLKSLDVTEGTARIYARLRGGRGRRHLLADAAGCVTAPFLRASRRNGSGFPDCPDNKAHGSGHEQRGIWLIGERFIDRLLKISTDRADLLCGFVCNILKLAGGTIYALLRRARRVFDRAFDVHGLALRLRRNNEACRTSVATLSEIFIEDISRPPVFPLSATHGAGSQPDPAARGREV